MVELCKQDTKVYLSNLHGDVQETTVGELLPGAFLRRIYMNRKGYKSGFVSIGRPNVGKSTF